MIGIAITLVAIFLTSAVAGSAFVKSLGAANKAQRPSLNPNGIPSISPALRRGSYAGEPARGAINPERVVSVPADHTTHGGGSTLFRVAPVSDA